MPAHARRTPVVEVVRAVTFISQNLRRTNRHLPFCSLLHEGGEDVIVPCPRAPERRHLVLCIFMMPVTFPYFSSAAKRLLVFPREMTISETLFTNRKIEGEENILQILYNVCIYFSRRRPMIRLMVSERVVDKVYSYCIKNS